MTTLNLGDAFTPEGTQGAVEAATTEKVEEKETPSETPTEAKPVEEPTQVESPKQDADVLEKQLLGLQQEKSKLLEEVKHLRGTKRELKQEQIVTVQKEMDDLKDVNPEDASLIERVLRSKGYVSKDEVHKMYYKSVQDQVIAAFLEKFPEYKPENDSQDVNWNTLQRELADYRMPENPHDIHRVLEKAHRSITKSVSDQNLPAKKRAVETASTGTGGIQRSSSAKSLDLNKRRALEEGGWSEEEIKAIENKL